MIKIPNRVAPAYDRNTLENINGSKVTQPLDRNTLTQPLQPAAGISDIQEASRPTLTFGDSIPAPSLTFGEQEPRQSQMPSAQTAAPSLSFGEPASVQHQMPSAPAPRPAPAPSPAPAPVPAPAPAHRPVPQLHNLIQKGQKITLFPQAGAPDVRCLLGWNTCRAEVDIDVSAFMLGANGKVPGEEWFVFYGQTTSPDGAVSHEVLNGGSDRQAVNIRLSAVNPSVSKIVMVLTINEALTRNLNFSMAQDAYVRLVKAQDNTEIVSYRLSDYYPNVISMMIGEIYRHGNDWKFSAVGNGVARDLEGLCQLYGVETV